MNANRLRLHTPALGKSTGDDLAVLGAMLQGFAQACVDLNVVAGSRAHELIEDIDIMQWYPFEHLREIEKMVMNSYQNPAVILERVGIEMMRTWYQFGPGKEIIKTGIEFLHFQAGSQGYASVVRGPEMMVGSFELREFDEEDRRAVIHSTTPFQKDLERGVIIGGMSAPGDLDLVDVDNSEYANLFYVEF